MKRLVCGIALVLLSACGGDKDEPVSAEPFPPPPTGVYAGNFPCNNCPGIDTALWLRPDGRYLFEQHYRADETAGESASTTRSLGRWQWQEMDGLLVLSGEGPARQFEVADTGELHMRTWSPVEHRLDYRDAGSTFPGAIRMIGSVRSVGDSYQFAECLTAYELPLEKLGDYVRFRRLFRGVVPAGESAMVEISGTVGFDAAGDPASIRIEHFVRMLDRPGC